MQTLEAFLVILNEYIYGRLTDPDVELNKNGDLACNDSEDLSPGKTSPLKQFMAKLCHHHQRQIIDALEYLQTEVAGTTSSLSLEPTSLDVNIKPLVERDQTAECIYQGQEDYVVDQSSSGKGTSTHNVGEFLSKENAEQIPATAGLDDSSGPPASSVCSDLPPNPQYSKDCSEQLEMEGNVCDSIHMNCSTSHPVKKSVTGQFTSTCCATESHSTNTQMLSIRRELSGSDHVVGQSSLSSQRRSSKGDTKDLPLRSSLLKRSFDALSPVFPGRARKSIRAARPQSREKILRLSNDPDCDRDIIYVNKHITSCKPEPKKRVYSRPNARKSIRGYLYVEQYLEMKTVRTLAGRASRNLELGLCPSLMGNCPAITADVVTLVTPKQVFSKPDGIPPVETPFEGDHTDTTGPNVPSEKATDKELVGEKTDWDLPVNQEVESEQIPQSLEEEPKIGQSQSQDLQVSKSVLTEISFETLVKEGDVRNKVEDQDDTIAVGSEENLAALNVTSNQTLNTGLQEEKELLESSSLDSKLCVFLPKEHCDPEDMGFSNDLTKSVQFNSSHIETKLAESKLDAVSMETVKVTGELLDQVLVANSVERECQVVPSIEKQNDFEQSLNVRGGESGEVNELDSKGCEILKEEEVNSSSDRQLRSKVAKYPREAQLEVLNEPEKNGSKNGKNIGKTICRKKMNPTSEVNLNPETCKSSVSSEREAVIRTRQSYRTICRDDGRKQAHNKIADVNKIVKQNSNLPSKKVTLPKESSSLVLLKDTQHSVMSFDEGRDVLLGSEDKCINKSTISGCPSKLSRTSNRETSEQKPGCLISVVERNLVVSERGQNHHPLQMHGLPVVSHKFLEALKHEDNQPVIASLNNKYDKLQKGWIQIDKEGPTVVKARHRVDRLKKIWMSKRRVRKVRSAEGQKYSPVQMLFMKTFHLGSICRWFLESTETKSLVIVKKVNTRLPSETQHCFHGSTGVAGSSHGLFPSIQAERLKKHLKKFAVASPITNNPQNQHFFAKAAQQSSQPCKSIDKRKESPATRISTKPNNQHLTSGVVISTGLRSSAVRVKMPASARILQKYSTIREKNPGQSHRSQTIEKNLKIASMQMLPSAKQASKVKSLNELRRQAAPKKAIGGKPHATKSTQPKLTQENLRRIARRENLEKHPLVLRKDGKRQKKNAPSAVPKRPSSSLSTSASLKSGILKVGRKKAVKSHAKDVKEQKEPVETTFGETITSEPTPMENNSAATKMQVLTRSQRKLEVTSPGSSGPSPTRKRSQDRRPTSPPAKHTRSVISKGESCKVENESAL